MLPGLTRLDRLVGATRATVREWIAETIASQLNAEQRSQLDDLVIVSTGETRSPLQRFKETPSKVLRPQLLAVLEKIEAIRVIGLDRLDLSKIHPNHAKLLARRARRRENRSTARLKPEHCYPLLVCFLDQTLPVLVDQAVQIPGKAVTNIFYKAKKKRNDQGMQRGRILNDKILLLAQLARLILDENSVPNGELRGPSMPAPPRPAGVHRPRM